MSHIPIIIRVLSTSLSLSAVSVAFLGDDSADCHQKSRSGLTTELQHGDLLAAAQSTRKQQVSGSDSDSASLGCADSDTHTDPEAASALTWMSMHTRLAAVQSQQAALATAVAAQEAVLARILALLSPASSSAE